MHQIFCVILAVGLLSGPLAPQDLSVKVPTLKKAARKAKPPEVAMDTRLMTPPIQLSGAQLKAAIQPRLARPVAGITDFLRLDARTTFVSGKGSLRTFNSSEHNPKGQAVIYHNNGSIILEFQAMSGPATYVVDFEFVAVARDAELTAYVGDSVATTTVNSGPHHLLYLLEAHGGTQFVIVEINDGYVCFKGVDISIVE